MKRYILLALTCLVTLLLASCASPPSYYKSQVRHDYVQENWLPNINLNPNIWTAHADRWFYTDEPRTFDAYASRAPFSAAITAMTVRVPDFSNIVVAGPYKIQIYGRQIHNSVYILGPNAAARHVAIEIHGDTLLIHPAADCKKADLCGSQSIIVRIGIRQLKTLIANGSGLIEGKGVTGYAVGIKSTGSSEVLLTGMMNLQRVLQTGSGTISVLGAYAPTMDITVASNGNVNVSGHIGIRNIIKNGSGVINVIGADSDGLKISSNGSGVTAIAGYANLRKISVAQNSRVYLYWVNSNGVYAYLRDNARLGLAGNTQNLNIEANHNSRFEGRYLRANNVYVNTRDSAHANVYPQRRLFANASGNSTIYFFGSPNIVSRNTSGNGLIIPIFNNACPPTARPTSRYKDVPAYK